MVSGTTRRAAGFWIWLCVLLVWPLDAVVFRLRFRGLANVPATGGVVVVANHVSDADPFVLVRFVWDAGRVPRILAKESLFRQPALGAVLRGAGQVPVHRGTANANSSLESAIEAVRSGECVVVYAEGTITRDPDGWPMRAKTGAARLALATGAPVIPVAQWGAQFFYDRYGKKFAPLPRKTVTNQAGPPVDLSAYAGQPLTAALLRDASDTIMRAVRDQLAAIRHETAPTDFYTPEG